MPEPAAVRQESAAAQSTRNQSNVFRSPARYEAPEAAVAAAARRGQSTVFDAKPASPIRRKAASSVPWATGEDVAAPASPKRANPPSSSLHAQPSGFSDGGASGKSRAVHTSSRVMAPPGGRSQITFG